MIFLFPFFRDALLGSLLVSVLCAVIGTFMVTRRAVIAGGGMAHASLGGVGLGAWLGFSPLWGAALFAVASGFGIKWLERHSRVREDSAIAMLWTFGMALGILFAWLTPGFMTDLPTYLFGNILGISSGGLLALTVLTIVVLIAYLLHGRVWITVSCDPDFARTQGLPVTFIENLLTVLTALTVVVSLQVVGIIMVISLLSVPQATAALFASTFRGIVRLSALFSMVACIIGLLLSYFADLPGGASIILCGIALYLLCRAIKSLFGSYIMYGRII